MNHLLRLQRRLLSTNSLNPNPSPRTSLRHIFKPVAKLQDPDAFVSAFNLASSDPRFRAYIPIYDLAIRRLSSRDRPDAIETLIEHQKNHPNFAHSDGFASRLILLYGRAGMLDHAVRTFNDPRCPRTSLTFNSLLTSYARAGLDPRRIAGLVPEILASAPGVKPTVVSYNIVICALCERSELDLGLKVVDVMEKRSIFPNLITYNTLLNGFYSKGRFSDGEKLWSRMEEKDVRSYNARLRGMVLEKGVDNAVEVFDEMKQAGIEPDVHSCAALMKGYCKDGRLVEAKELYLRFEEIKIVANVWVYETLVPAFVEAKDFDFAVRLCNEAINNSHYLDIKMLQSVVNGLAQAKIYDKAMRLVRHVRSKAHYQKQGLKMPLSFLAHTFETKN